jgi:hypothetical protein
MPRGSLVGPAATSVQWPGELVRLQLRQAPVQALSQHTPSTHWFEAHSLEAAQMCPRGLGPQLPLVQAAGGSQSASTLQVLVQAAWVPFDGGAQRKG